MNALFDIIIPTYNNRDELLACMNGFEQQTMKDFRLLICIDGSTDDTIESIEHLCSLSTLQIEILQHHDRVNHGRNATRNLALPHIKAEYLAFLDSDAIPAPDFLEQHLTILRKGFCISAGDLIYTNADTKPKTVSTKTCAYRAVCQNETSTTGQYSSAEKQPW